MAAALLSKVLLSGAGASLLSLLIAFFIPNERLDKFFFALGQKVTRWGTSKWGSAFYRPMEKLLENSIRVCIESFFKGLDSDDTPDQPAAAPAPDPSLG